MDENGTPYGLTIHHIEEQPLEGSINYLFHQVKYNNFILKKSDIPKISLLNIMSWRNRWFLSIGSAFGSEYPYNIYYTPTRLKLNYDVIINWDISSAAEQLT